LNAAGEGRIDAASSRIPVWVLPTDEERVIARHTAELLEPAEAGRATAEVPGRPFPAERLGRPAFVEHVANPRLLQGSMALLV
jgi:hypothetical protein